MKKYTDLIFSILDVALPTIMLFLVAFVFVGLLGLSFLAIWALLS